MPKKLWATQNLDSIVEVILPNAKTEFEGRKKSHKSRVSLLGRMESF
jgi:hypothetical protein